MEILIALTTGADILILDEPTAALGSADVEVLGRVLTHLKQQGKCIVYITHKLDEVFDVADTIKFDAVGSMMAPLAVTHWYLTTLSDPNPYWLE